MYVFTFKVDEINETSCIPDILKISSFIRLSLYHCVYYGYTARSFNRNNRSKLLVQLQKVQRNTINSFVLHVRTWLEKFDVPGTFCTLRNTAHKRT